MKKYLFFSCIFSVFFLHAEAIPEQVVENIQQHARSNSWGYYYYDVLPRVIESHKYKKVLEVGVALGGHAEHLLTSTRIERYIGVDPFVPYFPFEGFQADISNYSNASLADNFEHLFRWVKEVRLARFKERCRLIRETSEQAALRFKEETLDCIFIDGNHSYEAVSRDLAAWYPKLKSGHLILGDDYWIPTVAQAVDDFFAQQGKEVFFFTSNAGYKIWAVYK